MFNTEQAKWRSEQDQRLMQRLADRLNRKKDALEARGWRGEGVYQWLCLLAGRYLKRYASQESGIDPAFEVHGWAIGRRRGGPQIMFDITQDRVKVDVRDGHPAWIKEARI